MMHKLRAGFGALAGAAALAAVGVAPAGAATVSAPVAQGFAGPLQFAVGAEGNLVVAQNFSATLTAVNDNTSRKDLVSRPGEGSEIAAVDVTDGYIVFGANKG